MGRVDDGAVRFTKDVDILLRRKDMPWVKDVLQQAGFFFGESMGAPFFLDSPNAKPSSAVDVIYANEKAKPNDAVKTPSVNDVDSGEHFRILSLEKLVEMKLTSYRDKDKVHLRDMIGVGLIDVSWPQRFPATLAARLQDLLDNPE